MLEELVSQIVYGGQRMSRILGVDGQEVMPDGPPPIRIGLDQDSGTVVVQFESKVQGIALEPLICLQIASKLTNLAAIALSDELRGGPTQKV